MLPSSVFIMILIFILLILLINNESSTLLNVLGLSQKGGQMQQKVTATEVLKDLYVPWSIAFIPDVNANTNTNTNANVNANSNANTMLVTERNGVLKVISSNGGILEFDIDGVVESGEGGLLGLAVHPNFANNQFIYLYYTTRSDKTSNLINRVVRYKLDLRGQKKLIKDRIIIDNIPGAANHNGGFIGFGPDGYLYITTGDAQNDELAQDLDSLAGKILRLDTNGGIPSDNPFVLSSRGKSPVYTLGHRNPQGLTWDNNGNLWATEHGRSGLMSGLDEINLIRKGQNYGWPILEGDKSLPGMISPIIQSGPDTTWAPAGILYKNGKIYFTGLRGEALYVSDILSNNRNNPSPILLSNPRKILEGYGRLRALVQDPDGVYISTSNTDGRGRTCDGDDKILKITL